MEILIQILKVTIWTMTDILLCHGNKDADIEFYAIMYQNFNVFHAFNLFNNHIWRTKTDMQYVQASYTDSGFYTYH